MNPARAARRKRLKSAIIGCGWVAGSHVDLGFRLVPELFEIAVACDTDPERAQAFAARHSISRSITSYQVVLDDPEIDVVVICTPPSAHYSMVMAALAAGKHVICEKPFTSSLKLADDIIAAERLAQSRVMPIFQYRFEPGIQRIVSLLRTGIAGRAFVSSVETAWKRGPDYYNVPWRGKFATELGGVLLTQSIHIHDLFMYLCGPAAEVKAFKATRVNPIEVEDCAVASLLMADGSLASLTATLGSQQPVTRIRLCFENFTIERQSAGSEAPRPGREPWTVIPRDAEIAARIDAVPELPPQELTGFAYQFASFHDALETGEPFPVTVEDARRSLELITAIYHAAEEEVPVRLPIDVTHPRYGGWVTERSFGKATPAPPNPLSVVTV